MRYVCNTWAQLIRSPHFVESHLQRSRPGLFVQQRLNPHRARFLEFKENGDFEITNLDTRYPWYVSCSFDGILVFPDPSKKVLYVANPIIKDVTELPLCHRHHDFLHNYAIARLPSNEGYKLVCGDFRYGHKGLTSIYAKSLIIDDSWRNIGSVFLRLSVSPKEPIAIGQFIYWVLSGWSPYTNYEVVVIDIANESISKYSFPKGFLVLGFMKIGNNFAYVKMHGSQFYVYVSKDVHLGNWEFYYNIVLPTPRGKPVLPVVKFIACVGEELIFMVAGDNKEAQCFAYNMRTQRITSLEGHIHFYKDIKHVHTNNLVPCKSF